MARPAHVERRGSGCRVRPAGVVCHIRGCPVCACVRCVQCGGECRAGKNKDTIPLGPLPFALSVRRGLTFSAYKSRQLPRSWGCHVTRPTDPPPRRPSDDAVSLRTGSTLYNFVKLSQHECTYYLSHDSNGSRLNIGRRAISTISLCSQRRELRADTDGIVRLRLWGPRLCSTAWPVGSLRFTSRAVVGCSLAVPAQLGRLSCIRPSCVRGSSCRSHPQCPGVVDTTRFTAP